MISNEEKHTSPRQRIVIVVLAFFMLFSTFALYVGLVLGFGKSTSSSSSQIDDETLNRFNELYAEYEEKVEAQATELSGKYFKTFSGYKSRVKAFNAADVTEVKTVDLKVGTGAEVNSNDFTDYSAYYIGWLSDETIFDSSFNSTEKPTSLSAPLTGSTAMIQGWIDGIQGMRIGGVREISIPSALGYGANEQGLIPANSPLKFVVMLIEPQPEVEASDELMELWEKVQGYYGF